MTSITRRWHKDCGRKEVIAIKFNDGGSFFYCNQCQKRIDIGETRANTIIIHLKK